MLYIANMVLRAFTAALAGIDGVLVLRFGNLLSFSASPKGSLDSIFYPKKNVLSITLYGQVIHSAFQYVYTDAIEISFNSKAIKL